MLDWFVDTFALAQQWLFEAVVQPLMIALGQSGVLEDGFNASGWLLVGLLQIFIIVCVIVPWQRAMPAEPVTNRATIRTDIIYTLIHRLGFFRVALFFTVDPLFDMAFGALRQQGLSGFHLDQFLGISQYALLSFAAYVVVLDLVAYWIHRGQHQFNWWWQLHSLHHAQRQMTVWSDNRNHVLDDLIVDSLLVITAQLIGVAPGQFVAIVAFTQLSESFQHANLRVWFGSVGERLWVSPRFHRLHHAIGIGHESPSRVSAAGPPGKHSADFVSSGAKAPGAGEAGAPSLAGGSAVHAVTSVGATTLGGHNFGVLLPWWDSIFRTANYEKRFDATGVRDQVEQGRDYGRGLLSQQWLGFKRLFGRA
jgi:sterol desaturase/sphingolipid hydroxylase (fatty acid hydroxylase superfamily)